MRPEQAEAVIFDMDGVLVDTIELHRASWEKLAHRLGKPFSNELFMKGNGRPALDHALYIYQWTDSAEGAAAFAEDKEALFLESAKLQGVRPMPGVRNFLAFLQERGVPCAVGTSAPAENAHTILKAAGLEGYFQALVTCDDVSEGKPAPDIFLTAAKRLHVLPEDCVVIEDAPLGIQAAKAAGMYVIGITHTHTAQELGQADLIIDAFMDLIIEERKSY